MKWRQRIPTLERKRQTSVFMLQICLHLATDCFYRGVGWTDEGIVNKEVFTLSLFYATIII